MRFASLLAAISAGIASGLTLPAIFGSSALMQRDTPFQIWGSDTVGTTVKVVFLGSTYQSTTNGAGSWSVSLPSTPATATPIDISISSSSGATLTLSDIVFGDLFVCSGQSNMELSVADTVNTTATVAASSSYAAMLRIFQVATMPQYPNTSTPQTDLTPNIPWTRVGPNNVAGMSGMCYFFGLDALLANPSVPIGLIDSSWGGTAIESWMSPSALQSCGEGSMKTVPYATIDPGLPHMRELKGGADVDLGAFTPSGLYFSMIYPLLVLPLKAFVWYQGESNAGNPLGYEKCFPAMISEWRADWNNHTNNATSLTTPFLFVQLSSWPAGDNGVIATQRYAQLAALSLPNVGMAVAADLGDPSGAFHPIHPPWKQEVARRAFMAAQTIVYQNSSVPAQGPQPTKLTLDAWNQSWGDYHYGYGAVNVCTQFFCAGLRVTFNQPISIAQTFGLPFGFVNGLELWSADGTQLQPVTLTGVRTDDPYTVQLNFTWTFGGSPGVLKYGWHDYPTMPLFNAVGQAAPPFNVTIPATL